MLSGKYDASGFQVTASTALEAIVGTHAASAGMVSANIQGLAKTLHSDLGAIQSTIIGQTDRLAEIDSEGFSQLGNVMSQGFSGLRAISGASLAVQAAGFASVARQLNGLRGDVSALHGDLVGIGKELVAAQANTNARLESLVDFAARTLFTQEKILETLVSSKTVEAQQFIRQGWDNLVNGYEDDAFTRFQKSLEHDNTVYVAHAELGRLLEKRGELKAAEDHLRRATRFAASATPQVKGFAHVQFAAFLERTGQPDAALIEVAHALTIKEIEATPRSSWRLYYAELLAGLGRLDEAVEYVMGAIQAHPALLVAAMASRPLAATQPRLTKAIIDADEAARARIFQNLEGATVVLRQLTALQAPLGKEAEARCESYFRRAITAQFSELKLLEVETGRLAPEFDSDLRGQVQALLERDSNAMLMLARWLRSEPTEVTFEPKGHYRKVVGGIGFAWSALSGVGIALMGNLAAGSMTAVVQGLFSFAIWSGGASHAQSAMVSHGVRLRERHSAWEEWRVEVIRQHESLSTTLISTKATLDGAGLERALLAETLSRHSQLALPPISAVPAWVATARNRKASLPT